MDRLAAETSTGQHTTLTRGRHPPTPAGFEPAILLSDRIQIHTFDFAATGIGRHKIPWAYFEDHSIKTHGGIKVQSHAIIPSEAVDFIYQALFA